MLEGASHEAYTAGDGAAALELGQQALEELRIKGDDIAIGHVHRWLSRLHWYQGRRLQSEVQAQLAVTVLEPLAPSIELAWAYSNLSQLAMLSWRYPESIRWAERSIALAQQLDADDVLVHALVNVGSVHALEDPDDDGPIRDAIARARASGDHHEATRAMIAFAYTMMDNDLPGPAEGATREPRCATRTSTRWRPCASTCWRCWGGSRRCKGVGTRPRPSCARSSTAARPSH